uniref:RNA-directed RNA polymerase n=1 Tax=Leviviridae sp. TaxID=2027243 RepID=A0A514D0N2_9VIRU|nr:MAG: RNA-dependent RNA polymerase [Leviviridae sp.]
MKSHMILWQVLLRELGSWCDTSTSLDIKTVEARFEHEGFSFFTITLPTFARDLERALDRGQVDHDLWSSFHFAGGLPRFLGGFLDQVFDRKSGRLLPTPSIEAIFAIRQACLFFKKIALPCSEERVDAAMEAYKQCEHDVKAVDARMTADDLRQFHRISRLLFADAFTKVDQKVYDGEIVPKHGPGATAERLGNNQRFADLSWTARLETVFPVSELKFANLRFGALGQNRADILEPGMERPVRVIPVPKTLKTPRIIAIEPSCMQYVQQGILEAFLEAWRDDLVLSKLLGFDDQEPNRDLAHEGSLLGELATLDLSEASDRVSNQLVRRLTHDHPWLAAGVDACRSRSADVPGHGVIRLSKFASMGSALCFPMEACVFLTCVFVGIEQGLGRPLTRRDINSFVGSVRIFGDDIIVPKVHVTSVIGALERFGAKVNSDKSFWNGKFRESCGKDFYDGVDVSVVKFTQKLPESRQHVSEILASSATRNQLYKLGLWQTCSWLDQHLEGILRYYPRVAETSPVVGRHSFLGFETQRMDEHLHAPRVKGWVVRESPRVDKIDGEAALLKFFLKRGLEPLAEEHLQHAGRPVAVNLKLRWAPSV